MDFKLVAYIFIFALVLGFAVYKITRFFAFPHKLIVKEIVGSKMINTIKRLRIVVSKSGDERWYTDDRREIPIPNNPDSIEITNKGKKIVTVYLKNGNYFWQVDKTNSEDLIAIKPYTQNQRAFFMNQHLKAEIEGGFDWQKSLPIIASAGALIIVVVFAYLMFDQWVIVQEKVMETNNKITTDLIQSNERIAELTSDIKIIKDTITVSPSEVPN